MTITTKRGDNGCTDLCACRRVVKDDARIEALGLTDEISSFLGLAKSKLTARSPVTVMSLVQKDLSILAAELAAGTRAKVTRRIGRREIRCLERQIAVRSAHAPTGFVLPGKNTTSATIDVARALSRRLERRLVTLQRRKLFANTEARIYCNRLSDLLFLLARCCEDD